MLLKVRSNIHRCYHFCIHLCFKQVVDTCITYFEQTVTLKAMRLSLRLISLSSSYFYLKLLKYVKSLIFYLHENFKALGIASLSYNGSEDTRAIDTYQKYLRIFQTLISKHFIDLIVFCFHFI